MSTRINVEHLTKTYYLFQKEYMILKWLFSKNGTAKEKTVLKDISLKIDSGEIVGLIGKNGAGKSTLMKLIAGITFPTAGKIEVNGSVGSLINLSAGFNPDYTGRKNIYYKGMLLGKKKEEIDAVMDDIIEFVDIGEYFDLPLRMYSSGMSARLGFALAVFSDPDILIIDEALSVGDKGFAQKCINKMNELKEQGKTIIFISHSLPQVGSFCEKAIWIEGGMLKEYGDIDEVCDHYSDYVDKYNSLSEAEKKKERENKFEKRVIDGKPSLFDRIFC